MHYNYIYILYKWSIDKKVNIRAKLKLCQFEINKIIWGTNNIE